MTESCLRNVDMLRNASKPSTFYTKNLKQEESGVFDQSAA